jgi:hypothetical protein
MYSCCWLHLFQGFWLYLTTAWETLNNMYGGWWMCGKEKRPNWARWSDEIETHQGCHTYWMYVISFHGFSSTNGQVGGWVHRDWTNLTDWWRELEVNKPHHIHTCHFHPASLVRLPINRRPPVQPMKWSSLTSLWNCSTNSLLNWWKKLINKWRLLHTYTNIYMYKIYSTLCI